jgi:hypothetical protein
MALKSPQPVSVGAVLVNGFATAILPQRPYKRVIISVDMVNSVVGGAVIYRGFPGAASNRVTGISLANSNTYNQRWQLPGGQNAFVVWAVNPANISDARASFAWLESE